MSLLLSQGETLYANCIGLIILGVTLTAMAVLGIYGGWHVRC